MGAAEEEAVALEKVTARFKTDKGKGWDEWEVLEMNDREKIGQPTHGQLVIAATSKGFDFSRILGKSCVLVLSRGLDRKRYFKGVVFRIEHRGEYPFGSVAKIDFATAVRAMQHGQDSRVFENRTAPQILEEVFKEALEPFGREACLKLSRTYSTREYCVQYQESDWDFVQRLMADEGITFYIDDGDEEADRERLVLVDSNDSFPEIETMGSEGFDEAPLPVVDAVSEQSWFELQVVWDDTGEPVAGLPLEISPRDGDGSSRKACTTDSDGRVRLKAAPSSFDVHSSLRNFSVDQCAVFAGAGDRSVAASGQGGETQRRSPKTLVRVESRKVRTGETLESIAGELQTSCSAIPPSWDLPRARFGQVVHLPRERPGDRIGASQLDVDFAILKHFREFGLLVPRAARTLELGLTALDLAFFNFGTKDPVQVNDHLKRVVGCTRTGPDGKSYVFGDADSPGVILLPRPWRLNALASERMHVLRIKPTASTRLVFRVSLDIDPEDERAEDDVYSLLTEDGSEHQRRTAKDDVTPGDRQITLEFTNIEKGRRYCLLVDEGKEGRFYLFRRVRLDQMIESSANPTDLQDGPGGQTPPDDYDALEFEASLWEGALRGGEAARTVDEPPTDDGSDDSALA
jgi:hypothetical protein